jgi:putative protein-disulfide isomerase
MTQLHYIYDPLCGWCYGAKPLIQAARTVLPVIAHGGGMMTGANRQKVSAQLRNYVMPHDRRIAEYTGQPFGEAYFEGLLRDEEAVFDSAPPTAAVLAAEQLEGRGLALLERLQTAHYVEGRRIADETVLLASGPRYSGVHSSKSMCKRISLQVGPCWPRLAGRVSRRSPWSGTAG